jgi:carbonic anhydrase
MPEFRALIDGYRRFRSTGYIQQRDRWDSLALDGQDPKVMVIACSDSRVANLVPKYEPDSGRHGVSAALEFAVEHLKVHHIIVMGHAQCGGIKAALRPDSLRAGSFISSWMDIVQGPRERVMMALEIEPGIDAQQALEFAAIRQSLENLRSFPFVMEREAAGKLALRGAYFGISDGILQMLEPGAERFAPVSLGAQANS